jgi:hypothetical protein
MMSTILFTILSYAFTFLLATYVAKDFLHRMEVLVLKDELHFSQLVQKNMHTDHSSASIRATANAVSTMASASRGGAQ